VQASETTVGILEAKTLVPLATVPDLGRPVSATKAGFWAVSADRRALQHWDEKQRAVTATLAHRPDPLFSALVAPDGTAMLCRANGTLEIANGENVREIALRQQRSWGMVAAREGDRVWLLTNHPRLESRSLPSGTLLWSVDLPSVAGGIHWLAMRGLLVLAYDNGDLEVRQAGDGAFVRRMPSGSSSAQSVSADDTEGRLIVVGMEGSVHVIAVDSGQHLASIGVAQGPVHTATITAGGDWIAVLNRAGLLVSFRMQRP
jgi:hypothetical protein